MRTGIRAYNSIAWTGGRMTAVIKAGTIDLGEFRIPPEVLRR
jgi:hypothetical protein